MKTKMRKSAVDDTMWSINGLTVTQFEDNNGKLKPLKITTFCTEKAAKEEFARVTQCYQSTGKNIWRKRECATVFYDQLIIYL